MPEYFLPLVVPSESDVIIHDREDDSFDLSSYYISRSLVDIPIQCLGITLMSLLVYFAVGFNLHDGVKCVCM